VLLIYSGTVGISKGILDKAYKTYDEEFPHQNEVERRFRTTMDAIDDVYGDAIAESEFKTRLLFHPLFARFYDLLFTINSPLTKRPPLRLPANLKEKLDLLSQRIRNGDIPEKVAVALGSRDNNTGTRQARYLFFQEAL
jgi:hypothetical protein